VAPSDFEPALASIRRLLAAADGPAPELIKEATLGPMLRERAPELERAFKAELLRCLHAAPAERAVRVLECWDFGQPRDWSFSTDLADPFAYGGGDPLLNVRLEAWTIVRTATPTTTERARNHLTLLGLPPDQLAWFEALARDVAALAESEGG